MISNIRSSQVQDGWDIIAARLNNTWYNLLADVKASHEVKQKNNLRSIAYNNSKKESKVIFPNAKVVDRLEEKWRGAELKKSRESTNHNPFQRVEKQGWEEAIPSNPSHTCMALK